MDSAHKIAKISHSFLGARATKIFDRACKRTENDAKNALAQ
jgi:hypothetical protein